MGFWDRFSPQTSENCECSTWERKRECFPLSLELPVTLGSSEGRGAGSYCHTRGWERFQSLKIAAGIKSEKTIHLCYFWEYDIFLHVLAWMCLWERSVLGSQSRLLCNRNPILKTIHPLLSSLNALSFPPHPSFHLSIHPSIYLFSLTPRIDRSLPLC